MFYNLSCSFRDFIIGRFLKSKNIIFDTTPVITSPWPDIINLGTIKLGSGCTFRTFRLKQRINVRPKAVLEIGDHSYLNDGVNIYSANLIKIGHHVLIGDMTYIYDTDFHRISPDRPVKNLPVFIGDNVWVGANSMILAGSKIGNHSVIAAGSIVRGEIPPKSLAAGSPAKVIRSLDIPDDWVRG